MLVYGDRERADHAGATLDRLAARFERIAAAPPGLPRHAELVGALIEAGELAQGVADLEFAARGRDDPSPAQTATLRLCLALGESVRTSWRGGFAAPAPDASGLAALRRSLPSEALRVRVAEGYAFYALYPEAYLEAAEGPGPAAEAGVVGVRSIGAGLGAIVAAGLRTEAVFTVRPVGDPFRRELSLGPAFRAALAVRRIWAIADEGPGLSGSSFGAVLGALENAGVPPERIRLFPSHEGPPGPAASPELRRRWPRLRRHVVPFESLTRGEDRRPGLERWAADLVGEPVAPLEDLSGGAWRARMFADEALWPPVWPAQERRKYLLRTRSGAWLLKFAGLGAEGERKLERACALAAAGLGPGTPGLRHGFLVQRWLEDARPLSAQARPPGLLRAIGRYLAFRGRRFPASADQGASLEALWRMAVVNAGEALGETAAARLGRWEPRLPAIARRLRPVEIDGRLHAWEWLAAPGGRLIKTDALDHCRAHDLIGCQDLAWDLAGAAVELGLGPQDLAELQRIVVDEGGPESDPEAVALMRVLYLAFQLGRCAMAADGCAEWPREAARLQAARDRYAGDLLRSLEAER